MEKKIHSFQESLAKEKNYNVFIDDYFRNHGYTVKTTEKILDLAGIDRIFEHNKTKHQMSVEYKTDHRAGTTGNFFVEVTVAEQKGWFYTCLSQVIIVYVPTFDKVYWLDFLKLKRAIINTHKDTPFKIATCQNKDYSSTGLLIPLEGLAEVGKEYGPITGGTKWNGDLTT
jgi:hypothetical protein